MARRLDKWRWQVLPDDSRCADTPVFRRLLITTGLSMLGLLLGGCVTTEELYAEYDEQNCIIVVEKGTSSPLTLRELISNSYFPWEPAVYFDFDDDELSEEAREQLESSVLVLKEFPHLLISMQGFSDYKGDTDYNLQLAKRRVSAVQTYLQNAGIDEARLLAQPIGEGLPRFGSDDELSRSINRRVELMLMDELGKPLHPLFKFDGDVETPGRE